MSTRPFLEPGDVSPENARMVLDFLNAASSAQEIADTIEIPEELDIGIRLAQRILQRRAQLGSFSNLQQIADIPLIGPERFTEIVISLSHQRLPGRAPTPIELLQQEVAALRQHMTSGGAGAATRRRLTLQPLVPHVYLGQPLAVLATLTEDDQPVVDVPITFVATRGEVNASDGYGSYRGHLVTARTDVEGTVRLALQATAREEITPLQHDALLSMLSLLEPKAETPRDTLKGLNELARQYAWEVSLPFRQAVDIYVRTFRPMLLDTVNRDDPLAAWTYHNAAILAFAPAEGSANDGSSVAATATLHVRARDWIPPFLAAFVALTRAESKLTDELRELSRGETDMGRLVTTVYDRAGRYVASRWGEVGAYVGRKVAESSIRGFLDTELQNLPLDERVEVFPALDFASKTLARTDSNVLQGIVGTRKEIAKEVDKKVGKANVDVGGLFGRFDALEVALSRAVTREEHSGLQNQLVALVNAARADLTAAITTTRNDLLANINTTRNDLTALIDRNRLEVNNQLVTRVTQLELNNALANKVDTTAFNTFTRDVSTQFTTVNRDISQLRPR